jgi:hypothetical protein
VLGCCAHHGHRSAEAETCRHHHAATESTFPEAVCVGHDDGLDHDGVASSESNSDPDSPCDPHRGPCDEPSCVYLIARSVQASHGVNLFLAVLPEMPPLSATGSCVAQARFDERDLPPLPAQRVRALLQSWIV